MYRLITLPLAGAAAAFEPCVEGADMVDMVLMFV